MGSAAIEGEWQQVILDAVLESRIGAVGGDMENGDQVDGRKLWEECCSQ